MGAQLVGYEVLKVPKLFCTLISQVVPARWNWKESLLQQSTQERHKTTFNLLFFPPEFMVHNSLDEIDNQINFLQFLNFFSNYKGSTESL